MSGYTVTTDRDLTLEGDGDDHPVFCPAGVPTPVSKRQALGCIGRRDIAVTEPDPPKKRTRRSAGN